MRKIGRIAICLLAGTGAAVPNLSNSGGVSVRMKAKKEILTDTG